MNTRGTNSFLRYARGEGAVERVQQAHSCMMKAQQHLSRAIQMNMNSQSEVQYAPIQQIRPRTPSAEPATEAEIPSRRVPIPEVQLQPREQRPTRMQEREVKLPAEAFCNVQLRSSFISCGVHQLYGLDGMNPKWAVTTLKLTHTDIIMAALNRVAPQDKSLALTWTALEEHPYPERRLLMTCAFYVFSDADRRGNGLIFSKYILEHNLGQIVESVEVQTNPNSRNHIRVWIWWPDREAIREHVAAYIAEKGLS